MIKLKAARTDVKDMTHVQRALVFCLMTAFLSTGCSGGFSGISLNGEGSLSSVSPTPPSEENQQASEGDMALEGETQQANSTSSRIAPLWENKSAQGMRWTSHVMSQLDTIGSDLLDVIPADSNLFCPNYRNLSYFDRKQYWTHMISSMVRFESNFNPQTQYTEGFKDSKGRPVVSRGLLQLSLESGNAYGCGFKSSSDLHDPFQNLSCGVRILNRWLGRDGRMGGKVSGQWRGGARYWSVLRAANKTSYNSILAWSQNLSICRK